MADRGVKRTNPLLVFGRVPLFYFLGHSYLVHLATVALSFIRSGPPHFGIIPPPTLGTPLKVFPPDFGYGLGTVYLVWIVIVVLMYPACLWFARVKERRRDWWLGY